VRLRTIVVSVVSGVVLLAACGSDHGGQVQIGEGSLEAGQFAPISYTYPKTNVYGGDTYYFWVRAYDGERYGDWSTSVSGILN
jgi:hypothetical protein